MFFVFCLWIFVYIHLQHTKLSFPFYLGNMANDLEFWLCWYGSTISLHVIFELITPHHTTSICCLCFMHHGYKSIFPFFSCFFLLKSNSGEIWDVIQPSHSYMAVTTKICFISFKQSKGVSKTTTAYVSNICIEEKPN